MRAVSGFINGVSEASLSPFDRGLSYGHGLFETLRLHQGGLPLWDQHLRRLTAGADKLFIPFDAALLQGFVDQSLAHFPANGIVKITLTAGEGARGYRYQPARSNYLVQYFDLPSPPLSSPASVVLQPCVYRLPDNPRLAGIKHLNRLDQVLAASELADACDGLLLDTQDRVIEALGSNLFMLRDGRWLTPDLTRAGVAGVMRGYLQAEVFPGRGVEVVIADITLADVAAAEEVFICNAVMGIRPVHEIRGVAVWDLANWGVGSQTLALRAELSRQLPCFVA